MMCDQFGILHLPFAPARGYLVEMENQAFYDCKIPFHYYPSDSDAGSGAAAGGEKETAKLVLQTLTVKELVPDNCVFDDFLEKSSNRDMNLDLHGDASHADDADGAADDDVGAMRSLSLTASSTNTMTSSSILSSASSAKQSLSSRLPSLSSLLSYGTFFVASVGIGYMFGSQQRSRPGTLASTQTQ